VPSGTTLKPGFGPDVPIYPYNPNGRERPISGIDLNGYNRTFSRNAYSCMKKYSIKPGHDYHLKIGDYVLNVPILIGSESLNFVHSTNSSFIENPTTYDKATMK
jgi:hypothetical protein